MNILIVIVFCAYFAIAYSEGIISTTQSQLTFKIVNPTDQWIESKEQHQLKSTTVILTNSQKNVLCLGVLKSRVTVIFPLNCWYYMSPSLAGVYCRTSKGLQIEYINLHKPVRVPDTYLIPESLIEIYLKKRVGKDCWPFEDKHSLSCSITAKPNNPVIGVGIDEDEKLLLRYFTIDSVDTSFITVKQQTDELTYPEIDGEPLYHGTRLLGMHLKNESTKDCISYVNAFCLRAGRFICF